MFNSEERQKSIMIIDLHCHTKMSDGATGINELIEIAKLRHIEALAVTDHDTFAGSNRAVVIGKRNGVEVIPGVEISAYDYQRKRKVHVLCYCPKNQDRLEGTLKRISDSRKAAMSISVQKVVRMYHMPVDMVVARANGSTNIFKQHVMHALIDAGYACEIFGDVFQKLFHPRFGLAHTKIDYPDVMEIIDDIHSAGGVAVIAHPSVYDSMALTEELCEKKLIEGIEVNHPRNTEADQKTIEELAEKYNMVLTGGTDFHGGYSEKPAPLGSYTTAAGQFTILKKIHVQEVVR